MGVAMHGGLPCMGGCHAWGVALRGGGVRSLARGPGARLPRGDGGVYQTYLRDRRPDAGLRPMSLRTLPEVWRPLVFGAAIGITSDPMLNRRPRPQIPVADSCEF
jgi:hypothetical protein